MLVSWLLSSYRNPYRFWSVCFPPFRQGTKGFAPDASQAVFGVEKRQRLQRQLLQPAEGRCRSAEAVVEVAPCDAGGDPWWIHGGSMADGHGLWKKWMICIDIGWLILDILVDCDHEIISLFQWNWMLGRFVDERLNCRDCLVTKMSQVEDGWRSN